MDAIDFGTIMDAVGGGWAGVVIAAIIVFVFAYLKVAEKKARREQVKKDTAKAKAKDQAGVPAHNQDAQDGWDKAGEEIDDIRKKFREGE